MTTTNRTHLGQDERQLATVGLKAFFRIADLWDLDVEEQRLLLGQPKRSTFFEWKKQQDRELNVDTVERLSYLMGIYKALQILFPDSAIADRWIRMPAHIYPFNGKAPIDYMKQGTIGALYQVRSYLDGWRGEA